MHLVSMCLSHQQGLYKSYLLGRNGLINNTFSTPASSVRAMQTRIVDHPPKNPPKHRLCDPHPPRIYRTTPFSSPASVPHPSTEQSSQALPLLARTWRCWFLACGRTRCCLPGCLCLCVYLISMLRNPLSRAHLARPIVISPSLHNRRNTPGDGPRKAFSTLLVVVAKERKEALLVRPKSTL